MTTKTDTTELRTCPQCNKTKPDDEFYVKGTTKRAKDGIRTYCLECYNIYQRANRQKRTASERKKIMADAVRRINTTQQMKNKALELSIKYKANLSWVEVGLKACDIAEVNYDYFISRYLEKDGTELNRRVEYEARMIFGSRQAKQVFK
jgi:nitrate/TMAO reductase-like tetraheme cytochrome c subunit